MTEDEQEELRNELNKQKEFSPDNDAPSGQKVIRLRVKDESGVLQPVLDENGAEVFMNRKTNTVGNSVFAILDRNGYLLIKFEPSTMGLLNSKMEKITVNSDNRIMNMDGVECLSPRSQNDVKAKLAKAGTYTSRIDPGKLLYRMDSDNELQRALSSGERNPELGFFGTIGQAFRNLFGGGSGDSMTTFVDVLLVLAVVVAIGGLVLLVVWFIRKLKGAAARQ
jgi:hypothetical protein